MRPAVLDVPQQIQKMRALLVRPLGWRVTALCVGILLLNLVDAVATLRHLEHGAEELNPIMGWALDTGPLGFLVVKHLLASLGVIGIALHPGHRAAQVAMAVLVPIYSLLAVYQIGLLYLS
jgi:hypothetical protein